MSVQVLVSTMFQKIEDYSLLDRINIQSSAVVVNQCDRDEIHRIEYKGNHVIWVNSTERGLSRSRNMAIRYANADYCLIADDDEVLINDYPEVIQCVFSENPHTSIIRFQIKGIENQFKKYPINKQQIGYIKSMKMSSVEMAIRRNDILQYNLKFDELLGAGSEFTHGEENAFIFDCLKKGLKVTYVPILIAQLHIGDSTWFDGFNEKYFLSTGALFGAMSRKLGWLLILQFAVRKYNLYKKEMPYFSALKYMFDGKQKYFERKQKVSVCKKGGY